jgi:hypothetical protein
MSTKTKTKTKLCAVLAALVTTTAFAGQPVKAQPTTSVASKLNGELGVSFVSGYAFRGQLLDANPALQLSLGASVPFDVSGIGLDGGSVQFKSTQLFSQSVQKAGWFRSEVDLGISLTKGLFTVTPSYQFFNSPTGRFDSAHGFNLLVSAKDPIGLNPYVNGFFGVQGNANNGTSTGAYYEFGINPILNLGKVSVGLPAAIGVGSKNYYKNNDSYGYTTVGVTASYPILDNLNANASVRYLNTSNSLNGNKENIITTSVGLGLTF